MLPITRITLVHGTFAPKAEWTGKDSPFRTQWPTSFNEKVEFDKFQWSGNNSHEARHVAALKLAERLKNRAQWYPERRNILIAHSHGGNVALDALRDSGVQKVVDALVCLNTPFLHCERRNLTACEFMLALLNPFIALQIVATVYFYSMWFKYQDPYEFLMRMAIPTLIAFLLVIPCIFLTKFHLGWVKDLMDRVKGIQEERYRRFSVANTGPCRILCATVKGDEAYLYLWFLDRVSQIPMLGIPLSAILAVCGLMFSDIGEARLLLRLPPDFHYYVFVLFCSSFLVFIASLVVMVVVEPLMRGHLLSFGERFVDSLLLRISVKPLPQRQLPCDFLEFNSKSGLLKLKHDVLTSSPQVVRTVAEWIIKSNLGKYGGLESLPLTPDGSP